MPVDVSIRNNTVLVLFLCPLGSKIEKSREFRRRIENVGEGLFQSHRPLFPIYYLCIVNERKRDLTVLFETTFRTSAALRQCQKRAFALRSACTIFEMLNNESLGKARAHIHAYLYLSNTWKTQQTIKQNY